MTKMVSVDFWNTLVKAETNGDIREEARIKAIREVARRYGREPDDDAIREARKIVTRAFDEEWIGRQRTLTTAELVRGMLNALAVPASAAERDELAEVYRESFFPGAPDLADGVEEALESIRRYYTLTIISDTKFSPGSVLKRYLDMKGLLRYFDAFAFSDELDVSKPHPKAYKSVLTATNGKPEKSWHIGDMQRTDVMGAKAVGMKAILYTGVSDDDENRTTADYICNTWDAISDILVSEYHH